MRRRGEVAAEDSAGPLEVGYDCSSLCPERGAMSQNKDRVVQALNDVLSAELTAINQYFLHAKMAKNWGFARLHSYMRKESIDEMRHAEAVTERVLYLNGLPNLQRLFPLRIGETVPEMLRCDLSLEHEAVARLNQAIALCVEVGDNGTRALLESILVSEEEHIDWIDAQLAAIERVGESNWLAQQLHEG